MSAEPWLRPRQSHFHGLPSATLKPEAARDSHEVPLTRSYPCESRSDNDVQLRGPVWLAELGKPQSVQIYSMMNNSLNVLEDAVGIGRHLRWKSSEKEIAVYDSPYSHYSDWLELCPIVDGRVQLTNVHALKGKGRHYTCPLGVAPGSMLHQLTTENIALKKQD